MVGGNADLRPRAQYAHHGIEYFAADQPAAVVANLGPGIGKERKQPSDARRWQRAQHEKRIAVGDAHVAKPLLLHVTQQAGDAVHEQLTAEKAHIRMVPGLPGEVLAGAEAELEPHVGKAAEMMRHVDGRTGLHCDAQGRQQLIDQSLARRSQRPADAAAVDASVAGRVAGRRRFSYGLT